MGPSSRDDGNKGKAHGNATSDPASMGPSSRDDGNAGSSGGRCSFLSCFNGAVVSRRRKLTSRNCGTLESIQLQWGRRLATTETRIGWPRRRTRGSLQWGRRLATTETRSMLRYKASRHGGFNGAVVSRRRKLLLSPLAHSAAPALQWGRRPATTETYYLDGNNSNVYTASMGPSSRDDGNCPLGERWSPGQGSFNGAVVSRRRKPALPKTPGVPSAGFNGAVVSRRRKLGCVFWRPVDKYVLQWGRRLATTETDGVGEQSARGVCASMGPSSRDDGNRLDERKDRRWPTSFNGAVVSRRRKPSGRSVGRSASVRASMGPSSRDDGNL